MFVCLMSLGEEDLKFIFEGSLVPFEEGLNYSSTGTWIDFLHLWLVWEPFYTICISTLPITYGIGFLWVIDFCCGTHYLQDVFEYTNIFFSCVYNNFFWLFGWEIEKSVIKDSTEGMLNEVYDDLLSKDSYYIKDFLKNEHDFLKNKLTNEKSGILLESFTESFNNKK